MALKQPTEPLKSDGGSSLYYDLPIPQKLLDTLVERSEQGVSYMKTEEIIQHFFDNDFCFGNAVKSLVRAKGAIQGAGKAGNDLDYECNKVVYYAEQIREMGNSKEKQ